MVINVHTEPGDPDDQLDAALAEARTHRVTHPGDRISINFLQREPVTYRRSHDLRDVPTGTLYFGL